MFYNQPELIQSMGEESQRLATRNFDLKMNALKILDIYKSLLN